MGEALVSAIQFDPSAMALPNAKAGDPSAGVSFREVLSAVNPLQYLPVVGTIYRAATGDTIPEPLRNMGSFVASGLMGGPIGLVTALASQAFQKVTGIDMDAVGTSILHSIGIGHDAAPTALVEAKPAEVTPVEAGVPASVTVATAMPAGPVQRAAWTPEQVSAYGTANPADSSGRSDADTLNGMEMADISRALAAYGKVVV
jgi:hypothetical protein